jgi:parvulin-like peptidyl-prolyl isomerase
LTMKINSTIGSLLAVGMLLIGGLATAAAAPQDTNQKPATATAPATSIDDLFPDPVLVKGNYFQIKRTELTDAVSQTKMAYQAQGMSIPPDKMPQVEKLALDDLILKQLLLHRATAADKSKGTEDGDLAFKEKKESALSDEVFASQLKVLNLTPDTYRAKLVEQGIVTSVLKSMVTVTDADIEKFYTNNSEKFEVPELAYAEHIIMMTSDLSTKQPLGEDVKAAKRKKLDELLKQARGSADFVKLARDNSEDINVASNLFTIADISDLKQLAGDLKTPGSNPLLQYLNGALLSGVRMALSNYDGGFDMNAQRVLLQELNRITHSGPIYDAQRFAGVKLSPETSALLATKPEGANLWKLNRMLLLDGLPHDLQDTGGGIIVARDTPGMPPEFAVATFALKPGEISDIVTTSYGYHIVKLVKKVPAQKLELAGVKESIRNELLLEEIMKMRPQFFAKAKKEDGVEYLDPTFKMMDSEAEKALQAAPAATSKSPMKQN